MAKHHGIEPPGGMSVHCKRNHQATREDRFGRMFPDLPPAYISPLVLGAIGAKDGPMDAGSNKVRTENIAVGQVIFGQFIDHDITLDASSNFGRVNTPEATANVRTPTLDLDCIYGSGPEPHPFLFVQSGPFAGAKLLTGADQDANNVLVRNDLLRAPNNRAIIGDPRNDENRIISQMQLAIIKFHNKRCDDLYQHEGLEGHELYETARRETTWHYQWTVVNDFLVDMCGQDVVEDILACGRKYYCSDVPFIPIEFAVAAYRFGHSMVPMEIKVQDCDQEFEFFGPVLGQGFSPLGDKRAIVDWAQLFNTSAGGDFQRAEKLDTLMAGDLLKLPFITNPEDEASLATRNLLRGNSFLLPGGEKIAERMGRPADEIELVLKKIDELSDGGIAEGVPLWLYLLAEAEVVGRVSAAGQLVLGEGLGPVGGRIVAEVLIGLLELDPSSYLGSNRNWVPEPAYARIGDILASTHSADLRDAVVTAE